MLKIASCANIIVRDLSLQRFVRNMYKKKQDITVMRKRENSFNFSFIDSVFSCCNSQKEMSWVYIVSS